MSHAEESSWLEIVVILYIGILLVFLIVSCQRSNENKCLATGGTPLPMERSATVYCVYQDGRPPVKFEMR